MGTARVLGGALRASAPRPAAQASRPTSAATAVAGGGSGKGGATPQWAQRLQRDRQRVVRGAATAAHVMRTSDRGGGAPAPKLGDD